MSWDSKLFSRHLTTRRFGREALWFEEIDSTNRWLTENASQFTVSGAVVITDHQTQGRGRRERTWLDRPGTSLLCSVLLRHPADHRILGWLSMAPAVALAEVLHSRYGNVQQIGLKWPNDVQLNGKKIAGILGHSSMQGTRCTSVVGVGVNVSTSATELPEGLRERATSLLAETGMAFEREVLLAELLNAWEPLFDDLLSRRFEDLEHRWRAFGPKTDAVITRHESDAVITGRFEGLGARGQLLLRDDQGALHELFTGDLS